MCYWDFQVSIVTNFQFMSADTLLSLSLGSIHPLGSNYYRIFVDTIMIDKELIFYLRTEEY